LPDFKIELERHAAGVLAPDEHLLAAIRAMPIGLFGGSLGIFAGAAVGVIVQSVAISRSVKKARLSWFPLAGRMVIGITEHRILIWSRGGTMGGITGFMGEVPIGRVWGITAEPVPGRVKLTFVLRDAQAVVVEADRRDEPDRFAEIAHELASGGGITSPAEPHSSHRWSRLEPPLEPATLSEPLEHPAAVPQPPPIPPPPPLPGWKPQPAAAAAPGLMASPVAAPAPSMAGSAVATATPFASAPAPSSAPSFTAQVEEKKKSCSKCNSSNPASADFCWGCFAAFPGTSRPFSGYAGQGTVASGPLGAVAPPQVGSPSSPQAPRQWIPSPPSSSQRSVGWKLPASAKVGVAAFVVAALAAAAFIFTNQGGGSRIAMPPSIAGAQRIVSPQAQQVEAQIVQLAKRNGVTGKAGFYGIEGFPTFAVVGFDYHISEEESPEVIFRQFSNGVASANGASVDMSTLTNENRAGTAYICARVRGNVPGSVCMWSETDVVGFVLAIRQGVKNARALTTTVQTAIEN
jgi:hypothetical protein